MASWADDMEQDQQPPAPAVGVYVVLDCSGSMGWCLGAIKEALTKIQERSMVDQPKATFRYVCFADRAACGEDMSSSGRVGGSTDIHSGFELLKQKVLIDAARNELPAKIIVIFVSDGADNSSSTINQRLARLGGTAEVPNLVSVLFTVAVESGFPTKMVLDALRPAWHNASDLLPLVFPLNAIEDLNDCFNQLYTYMWEADHTATEPPQVDANSTAAELEMAAKAVYNAAVLRASREPVKTKAVELLRAAKQPLEAITAAARQREARLAGELGPLSGAPGPIKPLLSRQIAKYKAERQDTLTVVQTLLTELNVHISKATEGQLLERLSDAELAKALGYGNRAGRHLTRAAQYHTGDFDRTKQSLIGFLKKYGPEQAKADETIQDYIINQAEALLDAKTQIQAIENSTMNSVVSLVDVLPLVCRLIKIRAGDGIQINPWLLSVVHMPTVMKHMNSVDFFQQHNGNYADEGRDEAGNCLLPIARHGYNLLREYAGWHLASFVLTKNEALCFSEATAALVAATVVYCLDKAQPQPEWLLEELNQALTTYRYTYPRHKCMGDGYLEALMSGDINTMRRCLITEEPKERVPDGGVSLKCQHLTKFVLALTLLLDRPAGGGARLELTNAQLRELMVFLLAESVGRAIDRSKTLAQLVQRVPGIMKSTTEELLALVDQTQALRAYTPTEAWALYEGQVASTLTREHPAVGLNAGVEAAVAMVKDLGVKHYQFSERSVARIFASLAALAARRGGEAPPPAEFWELTPTERLLLIDHGLKYSSSADRNTKPIAPFDAAGLEQALLALQLKEVQQQAELTIREAWKREAKAQHAQCVLPFPSSFCARYMEETGVNLEEVFAINPETRLPRNACSCPGCPCFMRLVKGANAVYHGGGPRVSDHLHNHLSAAQAAPTAAYRVVSWFINKHAAPATLAKKIRALDLVKPCYDKQRERRREGVEAWEKEVLALVPAYTQGFDTPLAGWCAARLEEARNAEATWGGWEAFHRAVTAALEASRQAAATQPEPDAQPDGGMAA